MIFIVKGRFSPPQRGLFRKVSELFENETADKVTFVLENDEIPFEKRCEMLKCLFGKYSEKIEFSQDGCLEKKDDNSLVLSESDYIIPRDRVLTEIKNIGFSLDLMPIINDLIELEDLYDSSFASEKRNEIISFLKKNLTEQRIRHILSVERDAFMLSGLLGFSKEEESDVRLAALCHDLTRYHSVGENLEIAGDIITEADLEFPMILHGKSGAVLAKKLFGITDRSFNMILVHTTGKAGMNIYEKILWLADFVEEERPHTACREMRKRLFELIKENEPRRAVERATYEAMERSIEYLKNNGKKVHPLSTEALLFMKTEVGNLG